MCNGSRNCSDREKVTEQVITHWFQNKRKITRKCNFFHFFFFFAVVKLIESIKLNSKS
jgi:hypothetical protein